jgi:hypothetical protein
MGLGITFFSYETERYVSIDETYDKLFGNEDRYETQAFVAFPRSNIAGTLLILNKKNYIQNYI